MLRKSPTPEVVVVRTPRLGPPGPAAPADRLREQTDEARECFKTLIDNMRKFLGKQTRETILCTCLLQYSFTST